MPARRYRRPSRQSSLGRPWRRLVAQVVKEEPLCRLRLSCCTRISTTADHIIPRSKRPDLEMARWNLQGACQPCNMRKKDRPRAAVVRSERLRQAKAVPKALGFFE